ncbi:RNA polymerase-binding protein RbpA [Salana multivorans]
MSYWCASGHETRPTRFRRGKATPRCFPRDLGESPLRPSPGRSRENPPSAPTSPYKTHLAYVKERRSDAEGATLEALAACASAAAPFADERALLQFPGGQHAAGPVADPAGSSATAVRQRSVAEGPWPDFGQVRGLDPVGSWPRQ